MASENFHHNINTNSDFDEVVMCLYESIVINPCYIGGNQESLFSNASERKDQIIYHLNKTILIPEHAKLATDLASALLKNDNFRY
ncbi:hypothetical protein [Glaciecola sp. MF2-115]|uniref:hypothetical protein n=1 Tax=Glaciecola sp. MF2-115 TaxID=3384827 RepID=UPI0039A22E4E